MALNGVRVFGGKLAHKVLAREKHIEGCWEVKWEGDTRLVQVTLHKNDMSDGGDFEVTFHLICLPCVLASPRCRLDSSRPVCIARRGVGGGGCWMPTP